MLAGLVTTAQLAVSPGVNTAHADVSTGTAGMFVPTQGAVLDTRSGIGGVSGSVAAYTWYPVQVAGQAGVPTSGVSSIQVSVTAFNPSLSGYLQLAANGTAAVTTSALLYTGGGGSFSASSIVALSPDGKIRVLSQRSVNVLISVQGYYTAGTGATPGGYVPVAPKRLVDTRVGTGLSQAKLAAGSTTAIQVGGLADVPTDASAVFLMLTGISSSSTGGTFTPYASGTTKPTNVALSYLANTATILGAAVDLGSEGRFNLAIGSTGTAIDVVVDVVGYYTATGGAGGAFTPAAARVYDSRIAPSVEIPRSATRKLPVGGVAGVPMPSTGISAYVLSLQVLHPGPNIGFVAVGPGDQTNAFVSSVYLTPGDGLRSNLVVAQPGPDGTIQVFNHSPDPIDIVLDVEGWFSLAAPELTSTYFLRSQAIPTAAGESAANFHWASGNPRISSFSYSKDGAAPVTVGASQTELSWYPSTVGSHSLTVRGVLTSGVLTPPAVFSFAVGPAAAPAVPTFLAVDLGRVDGTLISGVVDGNGAAELTTNFYVSDDDGNSLGASGADPYGSAQITAGQRASLVVPAAALTTGQSYHWTMEACAGGVCSPRTADQTFVAAAPSAAPAAVATTIVTIGGASISGSSAPISATACANAPCQPTVDTVLRVGDQGDGQIWRSYLRFNLSAIPAGARLTSAILALGPAVTTGSSAPSSIGFAPLSDVPINTANGVVLAGLAEVDGAFPANTTTPSADLGSLVQGWLDGDHPNAGITIEAGSETAGVGVRFPGPSAASGQPTLTVEYEPPTVADQPTGLSVRAGDSGLLATWAAPAQQGTSKGVDHYLVTATSGGVTTAQASTAASYAVLSGLTNGTTYTVSVQAFNAVGASAAVTTTGAPQIVPASQNLLACSLAYFQARDRLQAGSADTVAVALGTSSCAPQLSPRLGLELPGLLAVRQRQVLDGHPPAADGSPLLDGGLVLPSDGGGIDVWAHLSQNTDQVGSPDAPNLSAQVLLRYGTDQTLASAYAGEAAWQPLVTGTDPNGVLTSDAATLAAGATSMPAAVADTSQGVPAAAAGIAQPAYKHTINRYSASVWATNHYRDPWYNGADNCTDFVSRALHFGGGMAYNYHHQPAYTYYLSPLWYPVPYGHVIRDDNAWFNGTSGNAIKRRWDGRNWTASYNTAQNLANFLSRNPGQWITSFGAARPGDVVFYAWTPRGGSYRTINHVGIVSWYSASDYDGEFWVAAQSDNYAYRSIWDSLAGIRAASQPGTSAAIYIYRPYGSSS
jgi:hypothetical protein